MRHSRQVQAILFTPTFKASSTWWSTTSHSCVREWAPCTGLDPEPRKASRRTFLHLHPLPKSPSVRLAISRWVCCPTCSWLCRMSSDRWACEELLFMLFPFFRRLSVFVNKSVFQWASGVGASHRSSPSGAEEGGPAAGLGKAGGQDGGEGSSDH